MSHEVVGKQQVLNAERGIGVTHPLFPIIEKHTFSSKEDFKVFAKEIAEVGEFSLGPLDLIAIWSKQKNIITTSEKAYTFARTLSLAYAVKNLENPEWKKVPELFLDKPEFPAGLRKDKDAVRQVRDRINYLEEMVNEGYFAAYGFNPMQKATELVNRFLKGDESARGELEDLRKKTEEVKTPLLDQLSENLANGIGPIYHAIEEALEE